MPSLDHPRVLDLCRHEVRGARTRDEWFGDLAGKDARTAPAVTRKAAPNIPGCGHGKYWSMRKTRPLVQVHRPAYRSNSQTHKDGGCVHGNR